MLVGLVSLALALGAPTSQDSISLVNPISVAFEPYVLELDFAPKGVVLGQLGAGAVPDLAVVTYVAGAFGPQDGARLVVYEGLGHARYKRISDDLFPTGLNYGPNPLRAVDANADGLDDLSVLGEFHPFVLVSDGSLSYGPTNGLPSSGGTRYDVGYADHNGDGALDSFLMVKDFDFYIEVGLGQGDGSFFGFPLTYADGVFAGQAYSFLLPTDLDGQPGVEVVVSSNVGLAWMGFGGLGAPAAQFGAIAGNFGEAAAVDLDGDGDLDIVAVRPGLDGVQVYTNVAPGQLVPGPRIGTGKKPLHLVSADFDGDGRDDVAVANRESATITVLTNDGSGKLTPEFEIALGGRPEDLAAGDLDLDGDVDLVVANRGNSTLSLLLNSRVQ